MQNCHAIQTLPLQSCSWEMFSNRECSLESSKASFINQLNPISSSAATEMWWQRWRQEHCLKLHHSTAKPSEEPLCNEELSRDLKQKRKGLGSQPPKPSLGQCSVPAGQGLSPYCKQHSCDATSREDNFPFIYHHVPVRMAEQNEPVSHQLSGSLDPLLELTKWQSHERQGSPSTMGA